MEADRAPDEELLATLIKMSAGDAAPEQYAALDKLVCEQPAACEQVVTGLIHLADLEWESVAQGPGVAVPDGSSAPDPMAEQGTTPLDRASLGLVSTAPRGPVASGPRDHGKTWRARLGAAAAFVAGIAAAVLLMHPPADQPVDFITGPPGDGLLAVDSEPLPPIATLVRNTSYVLESRAGTPMWAGASLRAGASVALFDGVAEIEFENGASVLLKGPAALEIDASGSPVLKYGGLVTRHVPNGPWRIRVPLAELWAPAGAMIGVDAFGEEAVVHAFEGDTLVRPLSDDLSAVTLTAGNAFRLRRDAHSEICLLEVAVRPDAFDFEARMDDGRLDLSSGYADTVLRSRPIAYWRFDSIDSGTVADDSGGNHPLQLIGEGVDVVRGPGNSFVSFTVRKNRGCFVSAAPLDEIAGTDYSVEFWFKPRHYHRGAVASLVEHATDQRGAVERHGLIIETHSASPASPVPPSLEGVETSPKAVRFLHRSPPGELLSGVACFSKTPYRLNDWQHLAAVKSSDALRLYLDGKLVCEESDSTTLPEGLSIVVGQLFSFGSVRPFVGELDELAFYDHALTEQEIAERMLGVETTLAPAGKDADPSVGAGR
ncbi:hypothetical protein Pla175_29600 [Pirellulimonas nuda]|uniref:LamG-like jellyroll fold domain-containing protein n=1 Tax=Pirellulimonas nuda TaxID=2528009 RepID=A0A518DDL3_9BACT|nr:LamG domain-containing protein [Pirellulimonas nuda]QDU89568.1 hypothetical protein Pla175_29600 [Pirellulimonas nuda]